MVERYSPLKPEQQKKLLERWKLYRELVGLECEDLFPLISTYSSEKAAAAIEEYRVKRKEDLMTYYELIGRPQPESEQNGIPSDHRKKKKTKSRHNGQTK
jgi:hypothetical protein